MNLLPTLKGFPTSSIIQQLFGNYQHYPQKEIAIMMASTFLVLVLLSVVLVARSKNNNSGGGKGVEAFSTLIGKRFQEFRLKKAKSGDASSSSPSSSLSSWWEELLATTPSPFRFGNGDDELFLGSNGTLTESLDENNAENASPVDVTHFCFLVHGHRGLSRDLGYVQTVMRRMAQDEVDSNVNNTTNKKPSARLIVHSVTCNEKKTDDGVIAGGERLVDEMIAVVRKHMAKQKLNSSTGNDDASSLKCITISLWGNSLGGLYARYAIGKLKEKCLESCQKNWTDVLQSPEYYVLDDAYAIYLNVFLSTATPHLGVSRHTYLPLPRRGEIAVAAVMGETGKDLFRLNDLLKTMAVSEEFRQPLSQFRKRIACANAYGTDFPVPANTAAFLSKSSEYPHHFREDEEQQKASSESQTDGSSSTAADAGTTNVLSQVTNDRNTTKMVEKSSLVLATLHTPSVHECETARGCYDSVHPRKETDETVPEDDSDSEDDDLHDAELTQMSTSLDALGWKKVFVDMRTEIPKIRVPKNLLRRSSINNNSSGTNNNDASNSSSGESSSLEEVSQDNATMRVIDVEPIHRFKEKGVVASRDVAAAVQMLPDDENIAFYWPMGHNMMVAFSRSRWSTYVNKAGRPVVDALAKELVQDIFAFKRPPSNVIASPEES